jgi:hypothetical protein
VRQLHFRQQLFSQRSLAPPPQNNNAQEAARGR